jgi:hypothetical protein
VAELGESSQSLLHLLERTASITILREPILEEEPEVAMRNADGGPKLMREHMQDVVYINRHAIAERSTNQRRVRHGT